MHKICSVLVLAMLPLFAVAQQGDKVKCKVVDGKTFKPVRYAVADIGEIKDTAGRNGVFYIYVHDPIEVHVEAEGYEPVDIVVQAGAAKTTQYIKMYAERRKHSIEN